MFNRFKRMPHSAIAAVVVALLAIPISIVAASPGHIWHSSHIRVSTTPTVAQAGSGIPWYSDNGTDIVEDTGNTQILTAPLAGLVAGSPVQIIAGTTGKKIRILGVNLTNSIANGTVQFQDETAVTPVKYSGVYTFAANGQLVLAPNKMGYMDFASGVPVDIAITGSVNVVGGTVTYCLH